MGSGYTHAFIARTSLPIDDPFQLVAQRVQCHGPLMFKGMDGQSYANQDEPGHEDEADAPP
jgi:hypothetical protein